MVVVGAVTAIGFMHRARVWFAAHGIDHIQRIVTDNGACYQFITPHTPLLTG